MRNYKCFVEDNKITRQKLFPEVKTRLNERIKL